MAGPPLSEQAPDPLPTIIRWARIGLTLVLVPVSISKFRNPQDWLPGISDINTAIHEFGHMLFMPFGVPVLGDTMVILGGSLTQVVFPLLFVGYFLFGKRAHRDLHAATVCLWWVSISLLELSVYVADARARDLTLLNGLTGMESDGHDWYNLLAQWGQLSRDLAYAGRMHAVATIACIGSIVGGLAAPWLRAGARPTTPPEPA